MERNWGKITNGATFEALARSIIFFEDSNAFLFGRAGKDGGQDARSGDGRLVFQMKHHKDASAAKAIEDAKKEARTIADYRSPGQDRYNQWKDITSWRLITNAEFNPKDLQRWQEEVIPLFAELGLVADYWGRTDLNVRLDKSPELDRAFFKDETRAMLSIREVQERLPLDEPFLKRDALGDFAGREDEKRSIIEFLNSDKLFLVVHGAGGIGKTRLLVEAGAEILADESLQWQVLWANIHSMEASATWFSSIIPERPTLLLVDEPQNENILRLLSEQLGGRIGRTNWKVAVGVRSPNDPVLRFLSSPRMKERVEKLPLSPLKPADAEKMCIGLLRNGTFKNRPEEWHKKAGKELSSRFSHHPIWITLAVHVLEQRGDLISIPQNAADLAQSYLDEVIEQQKQLPNEQMLAMLRFIALLGTVNREDDFSIDLIGQGCGLEDPAFVRNIIESLIQRRVLSRRGERVRLVEVKPDVMRDHLLINWLSIDVGQEATLQPSTDAKNLIEQILKAVLEGNISNLGRSILTSLGRTELIIKLSGKSISLLDPFFKGIADAINSLSASRRLGIVKLLEDIAIFHPLDCVGLSRSLRNSEVPNELVQGLLSNHTIGHDDIVLGLPWPVYHAAMGAQTKDETTKTLFELCELTKAEAQIAVRLEKGLPNDGKRADDLLGRVVQGGPQFLSNYDDAIRDIALELLNNFINQEPMAENEKVLRSLLEPALSLERMQTWADDFTLHIRNMIIQPGTPAWEARNVILDHLKKQLSDDSTPSFARPALWSIFAKANLGVLGGMAPVSGEFKTDIQTNKLNAMKWAKEILARRKSGTEELKAARELWSWYIQFGEEGEMKALADQLEQIYTSNDLAGEFEPLLSHRNYEQTVDNQRIKAEELAQGPVGEIDKFLERAKRFFKNEQAINQLAHITINLGINAKTSGTVRSFVRNSLSLPKPSIESNIATIISGVWISSLWNERPSTSFSIISEMLEQCGSEEQKINLIHRVYGQSPKLRGTGEPSDEEYKLVRSLSDLFLRSGRGPEFIACIGWSIYYDWGTLKQCIKSVLDQMPSGQLEWAVGNLIDALYWAIRENTDDSRPPPPNIATWLLDQIIQLPELVQADSSHHWRIGEILKKVGLAPLSWLPQALIIRSEMEAKSNYAIHALNYHPSLPHYVMHISTENINDPEIVDNVNPLVDLVFYQGTIGYLIGEVLQKVDPEGLLIPDKIARRFIATSIWKEELLLAHIGGAYPLESIGWKKIAKPVLERSREVNDENKKSLFSALSDHGIRSWSGTPGEVPPIFISEVEKAKQRLQKETDELFKPFWEWRLKVAEWELHSQEEHAKEERGE